jgi:hypothetical protein
LSIGNGRPGLPAQVYIGGINEIITYARTLSDGERRQVEAYLARKWNLTYLLPGINSNLLAPTTVTGCALWLDAADSSTIDLSGSTVIRWRDKSGNGRDASGGVPPMYTSNAINGLNAVTFNGSNTFLFTSDVYSLREFHVFAVVQRLATIVSNSSAPTCIVSSQTYGSNNRNPHIGWITNNQLKLGFFNNDLIFTSFSNYTSPDPVYLLNCSYVLRSRRIIVNGVSAAFDSNRSFIQSGITMVMGRFSNTFFNGNIAEYIVYTGSLLDRDRRQIEGYLATKWNIPGFENQHNFKIAPVLNTPFNPNAISNCALWLDAADSSTLTLSGSNVTQWVDKSPSALVFTQATSAARPSLLTSGPFSQSVYFSTAQTMSSSNTGILGPQQTWFVVFNSSNGVFFVEQSANTNNSNGSFLYGGNGDLHFIRRGTGTNNIIDSIGFDTIPFSGNTSYIASFVNGNTSTGMIWRIDGTARPTSFRVKAFSTISGNATDRFYINSRVPANVYHAEILVFNAALSLAEVARVEGYLARKWGLQNSLPSTHPYSNLTVPI